MMILHGIAHGVIHGIEENAKRDNERKKKRVDEINNYLTDVDRASRGISFKSIPYQKNVEWTLPQIKYEKLSGDGFIMSQRFVPSTSNFDLIKQERDWLLEDTKKFEKGEHSSKVADRIFYILLIAFFIGYGLYETYFK